MKLNTKTRYGIRAMIEIAMNKKDTGIYQKDISKNQDISFKYLDQIISTLKSSGLIANIGGRKSGYRLNNSARNIVVYDIYKAFNSDLQIIECVTEGNSCDRDNTCGAKDFWCGLNEHIIKYMKSVSLEELVLKQQEINQNKQEIMFYI